MSSWWRIKTNIKDPFSLKKEDSNVPIYVYFIFHVCMRVIIQNKCIVASRHLEVIWGKTPISHHGKHGGNILTGGRGERGRSNSLCKLW
jgi:hypothetical protein